MMMMMMMMMKKKQEGIKDPILESLPHEGTGHGNLQQDGKFNVEGIIEIILLLQAGLRKLYT
jgi:hypothetical protein